MCLIKNHLITLIVPVYNSEDRLEQCLTSIFNQTYSNFEVVIIDDGSSDASSEICLRFVNRDCRFHYFYQKNQGVSSARNKGIEYSKGKYISFVDADDILTQNYLNKFISNAQGVDFICMGFIQGESFETGRSFYSTPGIYTNSELISKCLKDLNVQGYCWNKFYSNEILKKNNILFDTTIFIAEDLLFNIEYLDKVVNGKIISDTEYLYFEKPDSVIRQKISHSNFHNRVTILWSKMKIVDILSKNNKNILEVKMLKKSIAKDAAYYYKINKKLKLDFGTDLKKIFKKYYSFSDFDLKNNIRIILNFYFLNLF